MDFIELPLSRLQNAVRLFVGPSGELSDADAITVQIELRRRALRDIEVIRCRLRPFLHCDGKEVRPNARCRRRGGLASRPTFSATRVGRS